MSAGIEAIRSALRCGKAGCSCYKSANVHCPAHTDTDPSLTVHESSNGTILFNCKAGCEQQKVIDELKKQDHWPLVTKERSNGKVTLSDHPVATYEYRNPDGELVAIKGRFEMEGGGKTFKWKLPGATAWGLAGLTMADMPLWGSELLADLPTDERVFLVEGEKATLACRALGLFALTHGGGASTTNFGGAFDVLRGRHVVLWPDNDEPGRRFMARVHSALRPIARSITLVRPPVPEKGDAVEYFGGGGTVADLLRNAPPTEPVTDYLAHDAIRVRTPSGLGVVSWTYTSMEKTSRDLTSELEVVIEGYGGEPYAQRLNLLSGSQRTDLRRDLDGIYGKDNGWAQLLNTAIGKARKAYLEQDRAIRLLSIPDPGPPEFLVREMIQAGVANVWFGSGSSLKTFMALRAAISVARNLDFNGAPVINGAVLFVDYENNQETFRFRSGRIFAGLGQPELPDANIYYWPARGIPLADQIDAVRTKVENDGILFVIVDSAAAACGGKPEDADIALSYFRALAKLGDGVTTLTIAHITKQGDTDRPFGSIFWENQPRRTWHVARDSDEEQDEIGVSMICKKVNDGRKPRPLVFRVCFSGDKGPVTIENSKFKDHPTLSVRRDAKDQLWDALEKVGTISDVLVRLNWPEKKRDYVKKVLSSEKTMFASEGDSKGGRGNEAKWGRVARITVTL